MKGYYLRISEHSNSCGHAYDVQLEEDVTRVFNGAMEEVSYYGYGKAAALRKYRADHGLKGKHIDLVDICNH